MSSKKDNNNSTKHRNAGTKAFKKADYHEAMLRYNQSLCLAEQHSINQSLAFGNRSAVYLEIGQFELCLKNIQLAMDNGHPNPEKLEERKNKCLEMMKKDRKSDDNFKLSHEANEKIPYIAACLQMREDQNYGRYIITNKDLKVGDIISIEPLFAAIPSVAENFLRCYNCFESKMMDLMPCEHCANVMFCSGECEDEMRKLHFYEDHIIGPKGNIMNFMRIFSKALIACNNSIDELKTFMKQNAGRRFSVFDFDFSDPNDSSYDKHRLLTFKSLMPEEGKRSELKQIWSQFCQQNKRKFNEYWKTAHHFEFMEDLMMEFFLIFSLNTHGLSWYSKPVRRMKQSLLDDEAIRNSYAAGLFPFSSLISHSCAPNCNTINANGNKLMIYVQLPVKAGEQIFISYGKSFSVTPYRQRQIALMENYKFKCTCVACVNNFPVEQRSKDRRFKIPTRDTLDSVAAARRELQSSNDYVEKHFAADFPSREIDELTERNIYNVGCIASDWMKFQAK